MSAPADHRRLACDMYLAGYHPREIAQAVGYTVQTICNWLDKYGVKQIECAACKRRKCRVHGKNAPGRM